MKLTSPQHYETAAQANRAYTAIVDELQACGDPNCIDRVLADYTKEIDGFKAMSKSGVTNHGFDYYQEIVEKKRRRLFEINLEKEFKLCD